MCVWCVMMVMIVLSVDECCCGVCVDVCDDGGDDG